MADSERMPRFHDTSEYAELHIFGITKLKKLGRFADLYFEKIITKPLFGRHIALYRGLRRLSLTSQH